MLKDIIKGQQDNSLTVNYNKWIFDSLRPYIGKRVFDAGAGLGNFLPYLLDREAVVAVDILDIFIDNLRSSYGSYKNVGIYKCDIQDEAVIELARANYIDTVICNNVLEHIQDDRKVLENINKMLNGRGRLLLVLPAFEFLYSKWDESVGHFRRYDLGGIKEKLIKADFSLEKKFYLNALGVFAWFLNGKILKNTPAKNNSVEKQAVFFDRYLVGPLRAVESVCHPLFGQSLVIIARPNTLKICAA